MPTPGDFVLMRASRPDGLGQIWHVGQWKGGTAGVSAPLCELEWPAFVVWRGAGDPDLPDMELCRDCLHEGERIERTRTREGVANGSPVSG